MRVIVLKDKKIPQNEYDEIVRQFKALYKEHADIDVDLWTEEHDLSDLPFRNYRGIYDGIAKGWIATEADRIVKKYSRNRFDFMTIMVHRDHWDPIKKAKIWGWNLSMAYSGLETQQVSFYNASDREGTRVANTLGTFFHETMHAVDTFVYRTTGKKVAKIVGVSDWDDDVVHGGSSEYDYIKHKEVKGLEQVAPYLRTSFLKREKRFKREKFSQGIQGALEGGATMEVIVTLIELFRNYINGLTKKDQASASDYSDNNNGMEKQKFMTLTERVIWRSARGFVAGAVSMAATVTGIMGSVETWSDLKTATATLTIAAIAGGITGAIMGADKYLRERKRNK